MLVREWINMILLCGIQSLKKMFAYIFTKSSAQMST